MFAVRLTSKILPNLNLPTINLESFSCPARFNDLPNHNTCTYERRHEKNGFLPMQK